MRIPTVLFIGQDIGSPKLHDDLVITHPLDSDQLTLLLTRAHRDAPRLRPSIRTDSGWFHGTRLEEQNNRKARQLPGFSVVPNVL
jgi:hypothetical protein